MLKWSKANAKIESLSQVPSLQQYFANKRKVYSLDLVSGYSCPFAVDCLSKAVVDPDTGKATIQDGPNTEFRCFSASQEVQYPNVRNSRWHNFNHLRKLSVSDIVDSIQESMPKNMGITRIHVGGDFFSFNYFQAWLEVARNNTDRLFYAYTKSLPYWDRVRSDCSSLYNFVLTASYGGRRDDMITDKSFRSSKVVFSVEQADALGLEIDHDDSHAADPSSQDQDFALLIHNTQPKGSEAAEAVKLLKKNKVKHTYSRG